MTTQDIQRAGEARGAPGLPPLAEAKIAPPRRRAGMVDRPRIARALHAGGGAALTLVAAPAGYGKTTAVRAWCAERDAAVAWVTLDTGDNDPVRFWTYVAAAVDRVRPDLARRVLRRLAEGGMPLETVVDRLMEGVAAYGRELVLVLDDVQAMTEPECHASIEYAVRRQPANMRLIVITRTDPVLPLPRLRAAGDLAEVRAADLAFTAEEAREFLVARGLVDLDGGEVALLHERTEG